MKIENSETYWKVEKFETYSQQLEAKISEFTALKYHSQMTTSTSRQLLETKEDACSTVQKILHGEAARFEMVPFYKYNRIARLRSPHYNSYHVLCHSNTTRSAGWIACGYILNGG